jgi:hypothetical protein
MNQVSKQADARMAQDAWAMAADRQRAAEAQAAARWTMDAMAQAVEMKKRQEAAWRAWQRAEDRAAV